jgi:hypothetical protein
MLICINISDPCPKINHMLQPQRICDVGIVAAVVVVTSVVVAVIVCMKKASIFSSETPARKLAPSINN